MEAHFKSIFIVLSADCNPNVFDEFSHKDIVPVTWYEVETAIKDLPLGKFPGLDKLTTEHYKYSSNRVNFCLTLLFTSLLSHNFIPSSIIKSVIVPIVKDRSGDISAKSNYRPIGLNSTASKIFEMILLKRLQDKLYTTPTELCIFLLKEILNFMHKHVSTSFIVFMDASKAFDRVNYGTLIHILHKKGIPLYILQLLVFWFSHSEVCVQWDSVISDSFMTINGVRQGGIFSPLFFNI